MLLGPDHFNGTSSGGPVGTFAVVVFLQTAFWGIGDANIIGVIGAQKDAAKVQGNAASRFGAIRQAQDTKILRNLVEAGGVEPPSEKVPS